jgi:intein/homing endonuclease
VRRERCGARSHLIEDAAAYAYILGLYLGDGHVSTHARGVHKLRISLDDAYPRIIAACEEAIGTLVPNRVNRVSRRGCTEVYAYSRAWPCFLPQVAPGRKHERPIALKPWQRYYAEEFPRDLLRGLIHSDGCRFTNQGRNDWRAPRYKFDNDSVDIRRIFCDTCDVLGLRWTQSKNTIYVSRKADVARMDEFIGPKR